ncbi:hypothetical protein DKG34_09980 [Streptomyces sp. NWU49]|nr:hypothetical protein DKG34_09980 [Streptomyces sp. NWU49]
MPGTDTRYLPGARWVTFPFLNEPLTPFASLEPDAFSATAAVPVPLLPDELSSVPFWHAVISSPAVIAAVATTALRRWRFIMGGSFRVGGGGDRRCSPPISLSVSTMRSPGARRSRPSSFQNAVMTQP